MNINDMYPSKYIKSADIKPHRVPLQVAKLVIEDIADGEQKPVMYFHGRDKGLVLGKTNAMLCAHVWGDESDTWVGQWLELFVEPKHFQGKIVDGLSVAPKLPNSATTQERPPPLPHHGDPAPTHTTNIVDGPAQPGIDKSAQGEPWDAPAPSDATTADDLPF